METGHGKPIPQQQQTITKHDLPTPSPSPDGRIYPAERGGMVREYVEMWDYAGGLRFRGFVAEAHGERSLFAFFDQQVIGEDLKPGYVLAPIADPCGSVLTISVLWLSLSSPASKIWTAIALSWASIAMLDRRA